MRYIDELRDPAAVKALVSALAARVRRPWSIMEVCGGQTHAFARFGLAELLPPGLTLLHGPGCPVCVTPVELIDRAIALARLPGVILCSFGDMVRVPGSGQDLAGARAAGADVRVVYSPLDALALARAHPAREIVFFSVGFETTAPACAVALREARRLGVANFSALVAHVRVPPALEALLAPGHGVDGFLAAGHVCTVMGTAEYQPIAARHRVPIVVTGFEPVDLLRGLLRCAEQLEQGRAQVENAYERVARAEGNPAARALVEEVFTPVDRRWRGLGVLPASGLALREEWADLDAARRFEVEQPPSAEDPRCLAGEVLRGRLLPTRCPEFGRGCTPTTPLGAPMVSTEGACAAYHRYHRGAS